MEEQQQQEGELSVWGFVGDRFRRNAISTLIGLLFGAIVYLYYSGERTNRRILAENQQLKTDISECQKRQVELIDRLTDQQIQFIQDVNRDLKETRDKLMRLQKKVTK